MYIDLVWFVVGYPKKTDSLNGGMYCVISISLGLDGSVGNTDRRHSTNPLGVDGSSQLGVGTQKQSHTGAQSAFFISSTSWLVDNRCGISCHFTSTHINHSFVFYNIAKEKKRQTFSRIFKKKQMDSIANKYCKAIDSGCR
jgi:hypothetical protein